MAVAVINIGHEAHLSRYLQQIHEFPTLSPEEELSLSAVPRGWSPVKLGTTAAQKKLFFNPRRLKGQARAVDDGDLKPGQMAEIAARGREIADPASAPPPSHARHSWHSAQA